MSSPAVAAATAAAKAKLVISDDAKRTVSVSQQTALELFVASVNAGHGSNAEMALDATTEDALTDFFRRHKPTADAELRVSKDTMDKILALQSDCTEGHGWFMVLVQSKAQQSVAQHFELSEGLFDSWRTVVDVVRRAGEEYRAFATALQGELRTVIAGPPIPGPTNFHGRTFLAVPTYDIDAESNTHGPVTQYELEGMYNSTEELIDAKIKNVHGERVSFKWKNDTKELTMTTVSERTKVKKIVHLTLKSKKAQKAAGSNRIFYATSVTVEKQ